MAAINNILGQNDTVKHINNTLFDKTFAVTKSSDGSSFALTGYTGVFKISDYEGGTVLYSASSGGSILTFSSNEFRINDKIYLQKYGKLYFELTITSTTDADDVYVIWYGDFYNYYNT